MADKDFKNEPLGDALLEEFSNLFLKSMEELFKLPQPMTGSDSFIEEDFQNMVDKLDLLEMKMTILGFANHETKELIEQQVADKCKVVVIETPMLEPNEFVLVKDDAQKIDILKRLKREGRI